MLSKIPQGVWLGLGAFVVYKILVAGKERIEKGAEDIATLAKKTAELITRDGPVKVTGKIILPDRQALDPAAVRITFDASNVPTFTFQGARYRLSARDAGGNYPAFKL